MGKKARLKDARHAVARNRFSVRVGAGTLVTAEAELTSAGLLAVGALASAVLLGTAAVVGVAVREARRPRPLTPLPVDGARLALADARRG